MVRSKRHSAGNLSVLLLGVATAMACVSGTTPSEIQEDDSCNPACNSGLVCQNGACVPPTGTGGSGQGGVASGGVATGGVGATSGGQPPTGGSGGAVATGGLGNGGSTGGTLGGGGFGNTGGDLPQGGSPTGGFAGSTSGQGGSPTGGSPTGGTAGSGQGGTGQGGSAGRGGTGQGGSAGSSTGGTGQAGFTSCNIGGQHNGDGSFTWYHFSQGTGQENGAYVTACGFRAPTSGTSGTRDTVENIASMSPASASYFVAIPAANPQNFDSSIYCGACVELQGMSGQRVVATVVDMCPISGPVQNPRCSQGAHLDVSKTAFDQLGFSRGDPSGTSWRFVPCPVNGNVKVRMKTGNNNEFFVENGVTSITGVTVNGTQATRTYYGAWHVNSAISHPATLNLTDKAGRMLTVTMNNSTSNQDTGVQFPRCQ